MRFCLPFIFLCCDFSFSALAQSAFLPKKLESTVNSSYDELNPILAPDGKTLYFTRANHPQNTFGTWDSQDIWFSTRQPDGSWSAAKRLPNLNGGRYNQMLSISADGKTMLINGIYNRKGTFFRKRGISMVTKEGNGWSTPSRFRVQNLSAMNSGMRSAACLSRDGRLLLLSFSRGYNRERTDLFASRRNNQGVWSAPQKIRSLSSRASEDAPYLAPDGKTLYFASDRTQRSQFDIYSATMLQPNGLKWTKAKKMSDTINTARWENHFTTNAKGSYAYFSSVRPGTGGADIFEVKLFEDNPFVIVRGQVINTKTGQPLASDKAFTLRLNGQTYDSVRINPDSASFYLKLPLGKKYLAVADVQNYTSGTAEIDVSNVKEFTRVTQNVLVTPFPFVLVSGKLANADTRELIPVAATPQVWIDGKPVDSLKIDQMAGTYSVKLPHGRAYQLELRATKFDPMPQTLNLLQTAEYEEIQLDLFATPEKMCVVTGIIYNKKTGKPFTPASILKVAAEGEANNIVSIDTVTSTFELKLPPGKMYSVRATAPDYYPISEMVDLLRETGSLRLVKDLTLAPIEVGQSIRLNNIFFETGKAVLKSESFAELDKAVAFFSENKNLKIEIGGHTDNVGNATTNLKLSAARAKAVVDYIVSKGVGAERMVAKGYGITKPVASNKTKEGRAQNRRVEFTILGM
jgi:outer membrane protein OmpA-like peptidoglycan-associated protein/ribosomal protein L24E